MEPVKGPPGQEEPRRPGQALGALEKRDWELWSIALILLTVFAGGVIAFVYLATRADQEVSALVPRMIWLLLFGLIALVLLLNIYLIDKKRTLAQLWRRSLAQEIELEEHRAHAVTDSLTRVERRRSFGDVVSKPKRGQAQTRSYVSDFIRKLESIDFEEIRKAAWALGEATEPSGIKPLVSLVKSTGMLRNAAIASLRKISTQNDAAATQLAIALMRQKPGGDTESEVHAVPGVLRRRSPRVLLEIPVVVTWTDESGQSHTEAACTKIVNAFGALVVLKRPLPARSELELTNLTTQATAKARVAWVGNPSREGGVEVGLELANADPDFWVGKAS